MFDKHAAIRGVEKSHALWRWLKQTAKDTDYAYRRLHQIQFDRPWASGADRGERSSVVQRRIPAASPPLGYGIEHRP
jgi:hypothetical protein